MDKQRYEISSETWIDLQETVGSRRSLRTLGAQAVSSFERQSFARSPSFEAVRERLLRREAYEYLWNACLDSVGVEDPYQHLSETYGEDIETEEFGLVQVGMTWVLGEPQMNLFWEQTIDEQLWQMKDKNRKLVMIEADKHRVIVVNHHRARQSIKRYIYWTDPEQPDYKLVSGWQPRDYSHAPREGSLPTDKAFALAYQLRNRH